MDSTAKAIGKVFPGLGLVRIVELMTLQGKVTGGRHEGRVDPEVEGAVFVVSRNRFLNWHFIHFVNYKDSIKFLS